VRIRWLLLCAALAAALGTAHAGQPCLEKAISPENAKRSGSLAGKVRDQLEASQLSIAFVGRIGMDMSEYGLRYTHLAVAWRDHPRGRWFTFHLLNKCGTGQSELVEQALEDFFNVQLHEYEALVVAPSFPLQVKMQRAFFSPTATALHEREYNMIAHPYALKFQNSNQWVLEVAASALAAPGTLTTRSQVQAWLKENGYVPGEVPISARRRAAAALFSAHVRFTDHTDDEMYYRRYHVVSVESVLAFLSKVDPGLVQSTLR
jgi:hypothetical protein